MDIAIALKLLLKSVYFCESVLKSYLSTGRYIITAVIIGDLIV